MNRRSFMKTGLMAAAGCALGATSTLSVARADEKKLVPIALQVYSLREYASKDLRGTLKEIAQMG